MVEGLFSVWKKFSTYFGKIVMFLGCISMLYMAKYLKIIEPSGYTDHKV